MSRWEWIQSDFFSHKAWLWSTLETESGAYDRGGHGFYETRMSRKERGLIWEHLPPGHIFRQDNLWPFSSFAHSGLWPCKMIQACWITLIPSLEGTSPGVPGWLSWLSIRLPLRSWSQSLWVRAPCQALCWQLRAWCLLLILCLPLCSSPAHAVSVSQK